jgi:hypothetical protein
MKRVALCDKHIFKKEIFKDEIRKRAVWNWKRNLQTAKKASFVTYGINGRRKILQTKETI